MIKKSKSKKTSETKKDIHVDIEKDIHDDIEKWVFERGVRTAKKNLIVKEKKQYKNGMCNHKFFIISLINLFLSQSSTYSLSAIFIASLLKKLLVITIARFVS